MPDHPPPETIPGVINALGGVPAVAEILGVGPSTVGEMKRQGTIDYVHWDALTIAAKKQGVRGIHPIALMRMCIAVRQARKAAAKRRTASRARAAA